MSNITLPALSADTRKIMSEDAANARAEDRIGLALQPYWDAIVANNPDGKRSVIVKAVLVDAGLWKDTPQKDENGKRTPFGNVVQRFGARYDAAVKRAKGEDRKPVDWARLIRQAVENGHNKGNMSADEIMANVESALATLAGDVEDDATLAAVA